MMKTIIVAVLLLMAFLAGRSQADRPNIVIILADDMGIGDVSGLNPESKIFTPHIDRLADNGMVFADAHTASSVCSPTRYGLLTGRYPWRTHLKQGVLDGYSSGVIADSVDTAPALLQRNGYRTGLVGKWHLGWEWAIRNKDSLSRDGQVPYKYLGDVEARVDFSEPFTGGPADHGFDYFYGISASLDAPPYVFCENDRVVEIPSDKKEVQGKRNAMQLDGDEPASVQAFMNKGAMAPGFEEGEVLRIITMKAVQFIRECGGEEPFFLLVSLTSPHVPVLPRDGFKGSSGAGIYGDFIQETDWSVGQIIQALEESGSEDNTLIVFTADNGASNVAFPPEFEKVYGHRPSGELRGRKGSLHEGGHHVPFIARWPGRIAAGTTDNTPICLNDLYATCSEILEEEVDEDQGLDSFSLLGLMEGRADSYERKATIYTNFGGRFSIRKGDWKMDLNPDPGSRKLFNLIEDRGEKRNLYGKEGFEGIERDLMEEITAIVVNGRSRPGRRMSNVGHDMWPQVYWFDPDDMD